MKQRSLAIARVRIETIVLYAVFAVYLSFLAKLLIFSRLPLSDLPGGLDAAERAVNLVPLGSIIQYVLGGTEVIRQFAFSNVVGNVIAFVPLGAYLPLFRRDRRVGRNLLVVFLASLLVEIVQWAFVIGTADIDDLILNSLGGLIGIWGYRLFLLILRDEKRVRTAFAILSVLGLPVLLYYLFVINLRL